MPVAKRERRLLLAFGAVCLALTIAVLMAARREPVRLVPEEPQAVKQSAPHPGATGTTDGRRALLQRPRGNRTSVGNPYVLLKKANDLLPERPNALRVDKFGNFFGPQPGSISLIAYVYRPDDDPLLHAYLDALDPALDKVRTALDMSAAQWRDSAAPRQHPPQRADYWPPMFARLSDLSASKGLYLLRVKNKPDEALARLVDCAELMVMLTLDSPLGTRAGSNKYFGLSEAGSRASAPALRAALTRLQALPWHEPDVRHLFEIEWRRVDRMELTPAFRGSTGVFGMLDRIRSGRVTSRSKRFVVEHREEFFAAATLNEEDYRGWLRSLPEFKETDRRITLAPLETVHRTWIWFTDERLRNRLARAALAIELYQRERGEYPESLAALGDDIQPYLPAPQDYDELTYHREGNDYWLHLASWEEQPDSRWLERMPGDREWLDYSRVRGDLLHMPQ